MSHFLVHQNTDDHHDVYGVFDSVDEFISNFMTASPYQQANLWHSYQIDEMIGTTVLDTLFIEDVIERDDLKKEAILLLDRQKK